MEFFVHYKKQDIEVYVAIDDTDLDTAREVTKEEAKEIKISCPFDRLNRYEMRAVQRFWDRKWVDSMQLKKATTAYDIDNVIVGDDPPPVLTSDGTISINLRDWAQSVNWNPAPPAFTTNPSTWVSYNTTNDDFDDEDIEIDWEEMDDE